MSYKFIKNPDPNNSFDVSTVTVEVDSVSLPEIVQEFAYFLLACGFSPQGVNEALGLEEDISVAEAQDE